MRTQLDLNSVMLFYEVVNAGSLTKAGEKLHVATSTISRRLAQLERQVGTLLLKKNTRKLAPTEIGKGLYKRCKRIACEVADMGLAAEATRSELQGNLRVSLQVEVGTAWLGRALAEFAIEYPGITLEIDVTSKMIDLIDAPYDVAIHFGRLKPSRLTYRHLATISRGIYASPDYLARRGDPSSIADLSSHDCVVTEVQQREGVWTFRNQNSRKRVKVAGRIMVNSIRLARELVIGGAGLGLLPDAMCARQVESKQLVRVLTSWRSPPFHATALILAREGIPKRTRVFVDFIAQRLADML